MAEVDGRSIPIAREGHNAPAPKKTLPGASPFPAWQDRFGQPRRRLARNQLTVPGPGSYNTHQGPSATGALPIEVAHGKREPISSAVFMSNTDRQLSLGTRQPSPRTAPRGYPMAARDVHLTLPSHRTPGLQGGGALFLVRHTTRRPPWPCTLDAASTTIPSRCGHPHETGWSPDRAVVACMSRDPWAALVSV